MKSFFIFILTLLFAVSASDLSAQSFLKRLGKIVEKEVEQGIDKLKPKENQQREENQVEQAAEQGSRSRSSVSSHAAAANTTLVATDKGQNIQRESDCDYIDEYGINHGGGILIGTVVWAPVNCGYHKTDYPYGKLYQWGRKHGQGYGEPYKDPKHNVRPDKTTAKLVSAPVTPAEARQHPDTHYFHEKGGWFNWTRNDMQLWNQTETMEIRKNKANDPCPNGWRVADLHDYQELCKNYSDETVYYEGGQKGRWFSGPRAYSSRVPRIFLPMGGYRDLDGFCYSRENVGIYWTDRHGGGEGLVWHFLFGQGSLEVNPTAWPHDAYSVRCVRDVPGKMMH